MGLVALVCVSGAWAQEPACDGINVPGDCPYPPNETANCGCDWFEDFETYALGEINPQATCPAVPPGVEWQNHWAGWYYDDTALGQVDDEQDHTTGAYQSMRIDQGDSQVRWFLGRGIQGDGVGYDADVSDAWIMEGWIFIPFDHTGNHFWNLNSHYTRVPNDPESLLPTEWHVQFEFNSTEGKVWNSLFTSSPPPSAIDLIKGEWAKVRIEMDFDADAVLLFYNDIFLGGWQWAASVGAGPDALFLGNLELSSDQGNRAWYDDISMVAGNCVVDAGCDDINVCTYDECAAGVCSNTPRLYGDIDGNGTPNVFDIFCILDLIAGNPVEPECNELNADIEPCVANGTLNVFDMFAVLDAIAGEDPCCAPVPMALIPAGQFQMGDHHGDGSSDELPVHTVNLDAFYVDVYDVTNQRYAAALNWAYVQGELISVTDGVVYQYGSGTDYPYCSTTSAPEGSPHYGESSRITWNGSTFGVIPDKEDHPMVIVSWHGAVAYANWRSAREGRTPSYNLTTWECDFDANGYRLPTEAEWEYAARGGLHPECTEFPPYCRYPWGDAIDGSNANYGGSGDPYEGPDPETTPVGYYNGNQTPAGPDMANGYGLYDMAGNVWEWCHDWHLWTYYSTSPPDNPRGPATGAVRVLRGGSWHNFDIDMRCAERGRIAPDVRYDDGGFRLALALPPMVAIPAGQFLMGDHHDGRPEALPVHAVNLEAFYMDVYEVDNWQYADGLNWAYEQGLIEVNGGRVYKAGDTERYCDTHEHDLDSRIHWDGATFTVTADKEEHPMVEVTWYGAAAYANWRSAREGRTPSYDLSTWECDFDANGYRLPTEAEWEYAARGGEHSPYYRYPWGDTIDGSDANYDGSGDPYETGPYPWTTPVGYYDGNQIPPGPDMANGYGLYDMAGNVWAWCNDWLDTAYYHTSPPDNPRGPATGTYRVLRGGSWRYGGYFLHCAHRAGGYPNDGTDEGERYGFRLARGSQ